MKKSLAVILISIFFASIAKAELIHITFDPPTQPDGSCLINSWSEQGVLFRGFYTGYRWNDFGHSDSSASLSLSPFNDTAYVQNVHSFRFNEEITDGHYQPFRLHSIDLAEYSIWFTESQVIEFSGHKTDGTIVTQEFILDGIIDSSGPLDDFQTFTFGEEFTDLEYVFIDGGLCSIDNIYLSPVPEPASIFLLGLGCLTFFHRSGNQKTNRRAAAS